MGSSDDSSRLSEALERLLGGTATPAGSRDRADDRDASHDQPVGDDEPYELPEIVPATADPAEAVAPAATPTLPARDDRPGNVNHRSSAAPSVNTPTSVTTATTTTTPSPGAAAQPAPATPPPTPAAVTSWGDHVAPSASSGSQLRAPGRRPRVRRVTRVLRHIDPWSTFKVALLFSGVAYLVALTSGVLLWRVADSTGTLDNVERWFTQFGWETFELQGGEIFRNAWIIGLFGVVFATGGAVLLVTLFNLVSDIVGGVRMTVLEEEVVERTASSRRRYIVRSGADIAAATAAGTATWSVDDDDRPSDEPTRSDATDQSTTGVPPTVEQATTEQSTTERPTTEQSTTERAARTPAAPDGDDWTVD